jgi:sugar phosphate isomerase/epimerase
VHAPDSLRVGSPEHDLAFEGLADLAARIPAALVVYHGRNFPVVPGEHHEDMRERCVAEERSLRRLLPAMEAAGVVLAIENLAPVHPGPPRVCHDPAAVADLVDRLGSPAAGMCFDLGHANIVAALRETSVPELLVPVRDRVVLFHVHDNLDARRRPSDTPVDVDPIRLDLHLPPGWGTVPFEQLAPELGEHPAPLQLEVHPSFGATPAALAAGMADLLAVGGGSARRLEPPPSPSGSSRQTARA